jgi:hypothetical protein
MRCLYAEDPFVAGLVMMSNAPAAREEDKAVVLQNSNSRSEVHPVDILRPRAVIKLIHIGILNAHSASTLRYIKSQWVWP